MFVLDAKKRGDDRELDVFLSLDFLIKGWIGGLQHPTRQHILGYSIFM